MLEGEKCQSVILAPSHEENVYMMGLRDVFKHVFVMVWRGRNFIRAGRDLPLVIQAYV